MEEKTEQPTEQVEKPVERKRRFSFSFKGLFEGKSTKERLESWSFLIIILSAVLVSMGIGLGSFVQGTILLASFGSFIFMIGIIIFIISQFLEEVK